MRLHSDFSAAFCSGTRFVKRAGATREVSVKEVGTIDVPSGRICLLYPADGTATEPFEQAATPGRYPVEASVFGGALACLRVRSSAGVPVRWELAARAGEDVSTTTKEVPSRRVSWPPQVAVAGSVPEAVSTCKGKLERHRGAPLSVRQSARTSLARQG